MSLTRPSQSLCVLIGHSLSASEQRELASRMEKKQMKEFMTVCLLTLRRPLIYNTPEPIVKGHLFDVEPKANVQLHLADVLPSCPAMLR
jgi:hypothetical protein